ncbi:hypothetical protein SLA_7128 [Streptomyces laurentii]|uniref:Uncharacterized protein n=1 Tax=Streptomyces laurentii TaxID=39478 RepID=A0A160P8W6_STRLU|nr:hypothetical protein SLA_7128 [Streptomyces laurentii]
MTTDHNAGTVNPQETDTPLPARLLALALEFTALQDDLYHLHAKKLYAPDIAAAFATRAAALTWYIQDVHNSIRHAGLFGSPVVLDVRCRLTLLASQAATATEYLRTAETVLQFLPPEETAEASRDPDHARDVLRRAGHHIHNAGQVTQLGAADSVRAAADLAGELRAQGRGGTVQPMSPAQYAALHGIACGYVTVNALGEEVASIRRERLSMSTVRSLEARGWVSREALVRNPGSRAARLYLTDTGRVALASRLDRVPTAKRPAVPAGRHRLGTSLTRSASGPLGTTGGGWHR